MRLRRLADRVVGVDGGASEYIPRVCIEAEATGTGRESGWDGVGGWRGGEYTAAPPRVWIEAEATGKMSSWGGWMGG